MSTHLPAWIFVLPFLAGVALPLVGHVRREFCRPLALLALGGSSLLSLMALAHVVANGPVRYPFGGWAPPLGIEWRLDGLSGLVLALTHVVSWLVLLYTEPFVREQMAGKTVPLHTLILLLVSGLTGLTLSADLFNLFVFFEMSSLAGYALVGVAGGRALVAAFRYLIMGTIGASFYLLSVTLFYAATGTLNMSDFSRYLPELLASKTLLLGLVFLFLGLAIKMGLFPLHGWVPDAYAHTSDAVAPLVASVVTPTALYVLIRVTYWVLGPEIVAERYPITFLLGWVGAVAMFAGACLALVQQDLKRLLAYSSISSIGLVVLGMSLGNRLGIAGAVFYLVNDVVMKACFFVAAGSAAFRYGVRDIRDLARLRGQMPWTLTALTIAALSMIGTPPTGGFFGKWFLVLGALEANNYMAVAVIVLTTLVTTAYFYRMFQQVFLDDTPGPQPVIAKEPWPMRVSLGVLSAAILALGFWSDDVVELILETALPEGVR